MKRWFDLAALGLVLCVSFLDTVIPPLGIPLALLCLWGVFRVRSAGWSELGMARPDSWARTVGFGVAGAIGIALAMAVVVHPVVALLTDASPDHSRFNALEGNVGMLLVYLTVTWTTAAFGEEILWRGFALPTLADVLGGSVMGWVVAVVGAAALFGAGHFYQGPTGMVNTGLVGLMLAGLYLVSGRNLWTSILAHGLLNTAAFVTLFLGW